MQHLDDYANTNEPYCLFFYYFHCPAFKNSHGRLVSINLFFLFVTTNLLILFFNVEPDTNPTVNNGEFFGRVPSTVCEIVGYSLYFSGISKFVWMSLLCYDLFHTLNDLKMPKDDSSDIWNGRLIGYTCVGVGVPFLMTLATIIVDLLKPFNQMPDVGAGSCFLTVKGLKTKAQTKSYYLFIAACNP